MHDSHTPGQRDFSQLDKLSTEELEELIRQDFQLEKAEESDMDMILHIMEVLENRRKESGKADDVDRAWKSFNENYKPYPGGGTALFDFSEDEKALNTAPVKPAKRLRFLARIASIAAIVAVILIAGTVTAHALGYDLLDRIARWTQETFGFISQSSELTDINPVFENFESILRDYGITDPILPTWIPDGYEAREITVTETPQYISFLANYGTEPNGLSISINSYFNNDITFPTYEIQEGTEVYQLNGIQYYVTTNSEYTRISWFQGTNECSIMCKLSMPNIEKMINSIYERK